MFSGKSEELIRRIKRATIAKQKVQVFKPDIDNRYDPLFVNSHSGIKVQALSIKQDAKILDYIDPDTNVVAIDEIQFFSQDIIQDIEKIAGMGIRVILAGLDLDFKGQPFGIMPQILCIAEYVDKLHAICVKCTSPATRTQRLINDQPARYEDPIILVGASESYEPRCRDCHIILVKEMQLA
ncbi:MAG: thymidine kinase [Candidatus Sericytochromatia bacterium]|nr:thymidine kinase [Candidatus Sericytochromatia bacterium]